MKLRIERISEKDLRSAHKIYNYYIINSYANFEEKKLTFKDFYKNYKNISAAIKVDNNKSFIIFS